MATPKKPRKTQSLVFDKKTFSKREARSWAAAHGYKAPACDEQRTTLRLRQAPPGRFARGSYATIPLRPGVKAVIAAPKKRR